MYKKTYLSIFMLCCLVAGNIKIAQAASNDCANAVGCEKKFCEIEKQIIIATEVGNENKLNGLNIALKEAKSNCSNDSIIDDLLSEIDEIEEDILEYQQDLKEAENDNKTDKISKYNYKIAEETHKLKQVKSELSTMQ